MRTLTLILCTIAIIATGLPLIDTAIWWIRIFDFPRIQIAVLTLMALVLAAVFVDFKRKYKIALMATLIVALVYQVQFVVVYTSLYTTQAKESQQLAGENSFSLLVSNVLMENQYKSRFHELVMRVDPDVVLINEPDEAWAASIAKLHNVYPYYIEHPLDNAYGMILLSKLPLIDGVVNFLVQDSIPSIFAKIRLPSGNLIDFYGVHPKPPKPGSDTYERDTELLIIGKRIKNTGHPSIVAGDLNDVGWSVTSKLFRKYSGLVDPREGRGLYNTYHVNCPLFRYPLDHIYYSEEFGLLSLKRLENIGSDHYPIMIELNLEPGDDNALDMEKTDAEENREIEKKIEVGKEKGDKE